VQQLSAEELRQFRDWFLEFEWEAWDRQIERDSKAGKQDNMSPKAPEGYVAAQTKPW
jgi:hypothetical protein